jgi:hypothetical protein
VAGARLAAVAPAANAAYANIRYQPEYAREQDVREGYYATTKE